LSTPEVPAEQSPRPVRDAGSPFDIYKSVVTQNYAEFNGRARRAEFWWFGLVNIGVYFGLLVLSLILGSFSDTLGVLVLVLYVIYALAVIVPMLAVTVRRLQDTNKSGWMILIAIIPIVGPIALLVFYFTDGDPAENQYGPSTKYIS